MKSNSSHDQLKIFNIFNKQEYHSEAFSRNIGLLTIEEQNRLSEMTVAVPGMGGVGGVHLMTMVRTGIGKFHIADFDLFEPVNVNLQYGARVPDFGRSKLEVMKEEALSVNPFLDLTLFQDGITQENIDEFLDGVDVVLDGLDFFKFDIRQLLFKKAAQKGIYVITAGPMGFSSAMLVFDPRGMGFDQYFNITKGLSDREKYLSFAIGLAPRPTHIKYMDFKKVDLDSKAGPSLNVACQICSGMAATEAIKILLKKGRVRSVPCYSQFDPFLNTYRKGRLPLGNKNPIQVVKKGVVQLLLNKNKSVDQVKAPQLPEPLFDDAGNISQKTMNFLVKAGAQAPSGDNCQPWKFDMRENRIDLFLDPLKDESFFNVNQIASLISCGAVIENIKIAASALGLNTRIESFEPKKNDNLVAGIDLLPDGDQADPLSDQIWKRHTNRKFYDKKTLPQSVTDQLISSIDNFPETDLQVITDRKKMKKLAKIIFQVDRIRTEYRPLHDHLMSMIRFTHQEMIETRDGLPLKNLEAGIAGELFLKMTKPWPVMNIMNRIGVGRMVALHSYQGMVNSSGIGLLTVDGTGGADFFKGGQALQRVWLTLTSLGLQMQPMTAITLFYLRRFLNGTSDFAKEHTAILDRLEPDYKTLFPKLNNDDAGQVMLFRFGFSDDVNCRTLRACVS